MTLSNFAFNYYSLALLESVLLWSLTFLTFLFIKNKSIGLKLFLTTFFLSTSFILGYVFNQGFYEESPISRLLILTVIPFQQISTFIYLNNFPTPSSSRRFRIYTGFLLLLAILIDIYLVYKALNTNMFFDFSGHFYEFNMPDVYKLYGAIILLITFSVQFTVIYKSFKAPIEDRTTHRLMIVPVFLGYTLSAILNILNKNGIIERGPYITSFTIAGLICLFIWVIIFINNTTDKSSFLIKIVGVGVSVFILIIGLLTFLISNDAEKKYDVTKIHDTNFTIENNQIKSDDLKYLKTINKDTGTITKLIQDNDDSPEENLNNYLYKAQLISLLKKETSSEELKITYPGILLENYSLRAYWFYLYYSLEEPKTADNLLNNIPKTNKKLYSKFTKIKEIPDKVFNIKIDTYLEIESINLFRMDDVIHEFINSKEVTSNVLKKQVLSFFTPIKDLEERMYGIGQDTNEKYVIYHIEGKNGEIYQVGYSYKNYREIIHSTLVLIFYALVVGILFFAIGIPFFLSKALITPLNELLEGSRMVRKGDLTVNIPIHVQDEIGFLSNSFNNMVKSIKDSKEKLKEYADQLEDKVKERTIELSDSLQKIELLKEQQDGDYFLTTLLLKPFGVSQHENSKITIDFLIKQKKEFNFRNNNYQIGGDICISQTIELSGKKYIVFLNADAMGKSMQGAGGILVLGAVFQSIIQRTLSYRTHSEVSPEKWIKNAFKEMHKIFETFDGSMLISLIFGLVEDNTGVLYYINAEHPFIVLYRDGVAEFLESELIFRKLGTAGLENEIFISTYKMLPGDTVIMGSDGKDDLILSKTKDGRVINEDETLFLSKVKESNGSLKMIYESLKDNYELMDDLSLMSIHYPLSEPKYNADELEEIQKSIEEAKTHIMNKHDYKSALPVLEKAYTKFKHPREIADILIKVLLRLKDYKNAAIIAKEYLKDYEVNTSVLFKLSYCLKMNHEFEEAIEMSERVRLREPRHIRNLIHLADLYAYTKNYQRANKLLTKVLKIEPTNRQAMKIQSLISEHLISV
jgi:methyl-accepting chemotaxis protein